MSKLRNEEIDSLFEAILTLENIEECYKFFEDACTIKELKDLSQRFHVAKLLKDGKNYQEINAETGMSTATICRVSKCLNYGEGGYMTAIERLEKKG